jgi:hypothetical protein
MGCSGLQTISRCCRNQPGPPSRLVGEGGKDNGDHGALALLHAPATRPAPARIKRSALVEFILVSMGDSADGLPDKLYWRKARGEWHCFQKLAQVRGCISLCRRRGSHSCRGRKSPAPMLPCGAASAMEWRRGGDGPSHYSPNKNAASL